MSQSFNHITASPLSWPPGWPRASKRKGAQFGTRARSTSRNLAQLTIADGADRVSDELRSLGVRDGEFIISSNLALRIDGTVRSGQPEPKDPGIAVYWQTPRDKVQKVMAIDIYDRVADNLAAIAASLSALRAIERHGGAQILERAFTGFTALPPPLTTPPPPSCWKILGLGDNASEEAINAAWRRKIADHHPDQGGGHDKAAEINAARDECLRLVRS